jgi:hypothetical protein
MARFSDRIGNFLPERARENPRMSPSGLRQFFGPRYVAKLVRSNRGYDRRLAPCDLPTRERLK